MPVVHTHSIFQLVNRIRDGLVYSIMSNIRGEYNFGPECFLSASSSDLNSDSETESTTTPRRDIRALVPLRLNRPWLHVTAEDIQLRLEVLYKAQVHTPDYAAIVAMVKMLERLGTMEEDSPKLELSEYREIFTTVQDGLRADDELYVRIISVKERLVLQQIQFSAECVWRVAVVNAALRSLEGTQISGETSDADAEGGSDYGKGVTFQGDLMALSGKINGLLLDSKDNFPEMEKWFGREEEERILETVVRVMKEAAKRRHM